MTNESKDRIKADIIEGVLESNLPTVVKDQYADQAYNPSKPYDQSIANILVENSFHCMFQTMKAAARALRNSDYVDPDIKRKMLNAIMQAWEQSTVVLLVVLPVLAEKGSANYDGTCFRLDGRFGETVNERIFTIFKEIPFNIVRWIKDDIYSKKMGPLLFDQLDRKDTVDIVRHELILLIIYQRPRGWKNHVLNYIHDVSRSSYYLFDVTNRLRNEYTYSFDAKESLNDILDLYKICGAKHITGEKLPNQKSLKKLTFSEGFIPVRDDSEVI